MENQVQITNAKISQEQEAVLKANMARLSKVKASKKKQSSKPKRKARKLKQATNSLGDFFPS